MGSTARPGPRRSQAVPRIRHQYFISPIYWNIFVIAVHASNSRAGAFLAQKSDADTFGWPKALFSNSSFGDVSVYFRTRSLAGSTHENHSYSGEVSHDIRKIMCAPHIPERRPNWRHISAPTAASLPWERRVLKNENCFTWVVQGTMNIIVVLVARWFGADRLSYGVKSLVGVGKYTEVFPGYSPSLASRKDIRKTSQLCRLLLSHYEHTPI